MHATLRPPFADLYPTSPHVERGTLTPRMAFRFHAGAVILHDYATTRPGWLYNQLPDAAQALYLRDETWHDRLDDTFNHLATMLEQGTVQPACTGDLIALNGTVEFSDELERNGTFDRLFNSDHEPDTDMVRFYRSLPDLGEHDTAFDEFHVQYLCEHDRLLSAAFNGDTSVPFAAADQWFLPIT